MQAAGFQQGLHSAIWFRNVQTAGKPAILLNSSHFRIKPRKLLRFHGSHIKQAEARRIHHCPTKSGKKLRVSGGMTAASSFSGKVAYL